MSVTAFSVADTTRRSLAIGCSFVMSDRHLAFVEFVLGHYIDEGVDELGLEKLTPLLKLKYHAVSDAAADLGTAEQIRSVFVGFQKYLYADGP